MKILLTGASGFLGTIIAEKLVKNHEVITLSRSKSKIAVDLAHSVPVLPPSDIVIHCAGKAHVVPSNEIEKKRFFDINVKGLANLLHAIDDGGFYPKAFLFISTVAVYGLESARLVNEQAPLLATDAYGASKLEAERLVINWAKKNHVVYTILRLPLLVGNNPPGNLGAMIKGISKGFYFNIDGGKARKSMVLAEDVAQIISTAAEIGGIYNLTDGVHPNFSELSSHISNQLHKRKPLNMPYYLAKGLALIGDILGAKAPINTNKLNKITSDLTFDDSLAREKLGWNPSSVLSATIIDNKMS